MKSANELKEIARAEIDRRDAERREKTINFLESRVVPAMERAAADGQMYISFYVDAPVDIALLMDELTANGYSSSKRGRQLNVYWM